MSKADEFIQALDDLKKALEKMAVTGNYRYCLILSREGDDDSYSLVVSNMESERLPKLLVGPIEAIPKKDELQ